MEQFIDVEADRKESLIEIIKNLLIKHKADERILKNYTKKSTPNKEFQMYMPGPSHRFSTTAIR